MNAGVAIIAHDNVRKLMSADRFIATVDKALAIAGPNTKVIPGHGPLSDRAGLAVYRNILEAMRSKVAAALTGRKTLEDLTAETSPTAAFDGEWGGAVS